MDNQDTPSQGGALTAAMAHDILRIMSIVPVGAVTILLEGERPRSNPVEARAALQAIASGTHVVVPAGQEPVAWVVDRTADATHMDAYRIEREAVARRDYLVSTGNYETVVLVPVYAAPAKPTDTAQADSRQYAREILAALHNEDIDWLPDAVAWLKEVAK